MKLKQIFFFLLISFSSLSYSQSRLETLDFINTMLATYSAPMVYDPVVWRVTWVDEPENRLIFDMFIKNGVSAEYILDATSIKEVALNRAPNGKLCLKLISPSARVLEKIGNGESKFWTSFQIALNANDDEVYRIRKAMIHLLKMKGATFSSEELFSN